MRTRTWPLHRQVEGSPFVRQLLTGTVGRRDYCLLLRSLHEVYAALEAALVARSAHPAVSAVLDPALFREAPLAQDLRALAGAAWSDDLAVQPAARSMAQRLGTIASAEPDLLVAYAYVRYLGDLSGGQVLRRTVADALALDDGSPGLTFYAFDPATPLAERAQRLRGGLDRAGDDPARCAAIVDEAVHCFALHGELFAELQDAAAPPQPSDE